MVRSGTGSGWSWAVAATMVAGLFSGCGEADSTAASDEAVQEWLGRSGADDQLVSPVAEYLGVGDPEAMSASAREQNKRQQQAVVECMREQGFEYVAVDMTSGVSSEAFDPFGGLTRQQFVDRWGYGISTTIGPDGSTVEDAPGYGSFDEEDMAEDPNQKIVASLSEAEQLAYNTALYGDMMSTPSAVEDVATSGGSEVESGGSEVDGSDPASSAADSTDMPDMSEMGCMGASMSESLGDLDESELEEMSKAEEDLTERVAADPKVKAATRTYRACMKDAGYPEVKEDGDARNLIDERMSSDVWGDGGFGGVPTTIEESEVGADGSEVDGGSVEGADPAESAGIDAEALRELQKDELALAKAELPCLAAYQVVVEKVRIAAEERFIDENADLLQRMKRAFG